MLGSITCVRWLCCKLCGSTTRAACDPSRVHIVDAEKEKVCAHMVVLIVDEGPGGRFRFKIVKHGGRWLVDFKQRWDGDWRRWGGDWRRAFL